MIFFKKQYIFTSFFLILLNFTMVNAMGKVKNNDSDPFIWLEEIEGKKSLDWVEKQNKLTEKKFENSDLYNKIYNDAYEILSSDDKLPYVSMRGGYLYNFFTDKNNERGIWRRTTIEEYKKENTKWENILDIDELAKKEDKNWVYKGVSCLPPAYEKCMIRLSDGGKDSAVYREFSVKDKKFVENGLFVNEAKSGLDWIDEDTLLVGTDWGSDSLTESGYPRILKFVSRDKNKKDKVLFEGEYKDIGIWPYVHHGDKTYIFTIRAVTFFESEYYLYENGKNRKLDLPMKSDVNGVLGDMLILTLNQDWKDFKSGDVIFYNLKNNESEKVYAPDKNTSVQNVSVTKSKIFLQLLEDVEGKIIYFEKDDGAYDLKKLSFPDNSILSISSASDDDDKIIVNIESPSTPSKLVLYDDKGKFTDLKSSPSWFDAKDIRTRKYFVKSKDGTNIPYFVIGKAKILEKGNAKTHLYAYGGFNISILPRYSGVLGKIWLENDGVYVIANIRGGGEYGPKWHQAALKENRQKAYDDFFAVSEDLIKRKITSKEKLVISGGSNGGLLMGVALTQRPDLYAGIFCAVPLLDMYRFDKLLAGASWTGEYGDPDNAEEWEYISKYSPYQNLHKNRKYTDVFFYTSTKDDRVHPGHARKMAAKMMSYNKPLYYYENTEGGHAGAANNKQTAKRIALQYSFFEKVIENK